MGIWHIVKTNIKRNKGASISFLCIILLASFMLSAGVTIIKQSGLLYERKSDEMHSIHGAFWVKKDEFQDSLLQFMEADDRITEYECEDVVYMNNASVDYGGRYDSNTLLMNADRDRQLSPLKLLSQDTSIAGREAIYLPYYATLIGYTLGDTYTITYKQTEYSFIVAGFFETLEFSLTSGKALRAYLSQEAYDYMAGQIGTYQFVGFRCHEVEESIDAAKSLRDNSEITFSPMAVGNTTSDASDTRAGILSPSEIMAGLLVGVAFIIMIITLVFLRFRIMNSMEDNLHSFGALQAIGYTTKQIMASYLMEYGMISLLGTVLGSLLVALLYPILELFVASMNGVRFDYWLDGGLAILLSLLLLLIIMVCAWISCRKIQKLTPVAALRGGIHSHNFRKNAFPLQNGRGAFHGKGSLLFRLGFKNMILYKKSYVMVSMILVGIAFILVFMLNLYDTFVVDKGALIQMTGVEVADASISVTRQTDAGQLAEELERMEEVESTSMYDWVSFSVDGVEVVGFCSDDFSRLKTVGFYEGDYPLLENEIVLSGSLASQLGKKIGDTVSIKSGSTEREYFISGFFSTINNGGQGACITLKGFQRIQPSYYRTGINVYLKEGLSYEEFVQLMEAEFGIVGANTREMSNAQKRAEEKIALYMEEFGINSVDYAVMKDGEILFAGSSMNQRIAHISNLKATAETQIGTFAAGISGMVMVMFLIAFLIVLIVVSMTVKHMIRKHAIQIGIQKAIGFVTKQLMVQYTISFLPSVIIGAVLGSILGTLCTEPFISAMFYSMGASHLTIKVNLAAVIFVSIGVVCGTVLAILAFSYRIRKISAYNLLIE